MVKKGQTAKQSVMKISEPFSDEVLTYMFNKADKLKMEAGIYFVAFILVLTLMIFLACSLFLCEPMHFATKDGAILWGVIVMRLVIFVPLIILSCFFGVMAVKTKKRCEEFFIAAFVFKEMLGLIKTDDKSAFLLKMLAMFLGKK